MSLIIYFTLLSKKFDRQRLNTSLFTGKYQDRKKLSRISRRHFLKLLIFKQYLNNQKNGGYMETIFIYPGTFCPPTSGHLDIARQAAQSCNELYIICSRNPHKGDNWFTPEVCCDLWRGYDLPANVKVFTFDQFKAQSVSTQKIVMVRGLRNMNDFQQEKEVMELNKTSFGIKRFFYIFGSENTSDISSSTAREKSLNFDLNNLSHLMSPLVISAMLEKVLGAKNIFLAVGRPGGGKSTFLKMISEIDPQNIWINTDEFNHQLRHILEEKFGQSNLAQLAIKDGEAVKKAIAEPWLKMLAESLKSAPAESNVFVEVAYGLQIDKNIFRFVGGKVIYIGCDNKETNLARINGRHTPELAGFIDLIPGYEESVDIAKSNGLSLSFINTDCSIKELTKKAYFFNELISKGGNNAYVI